MCVCGGGRGAGWGVKCLFGFPCGPWSGAPGARGGVRFSLFDLPRSVHCWGMAQGLVRLFLNRRSAHDFQAYPVLGGTFGCTCQAAGVLPFAPPPNGLKGNIYWGTPYPLFRGVAEGLVITSDPPPRC